MSLHKVVNYDNWKVHYAKARRQDLAEILPPEDVTAETWHHWRTLCGKDLIGRALPEYEVDCRSCTRAYEHGMRQAAELSERFG